MPEQKASLPSAVKSLSAKLLVLTIFFVMLSEVLIYAPSVGRYRKVYLEARIADAHLATLALEATPDQMVGEDLERELLDHARAYGVVTHRAGLPKLMLLRDMPPKIDLMVDLRQTSFAGYIIDAFETLAQGDNRVLRLFGMSPKDAKVLIEVILDEAPMRAEMYDYSERILMLSIMISLFTATLVYLSLHWLMVLPMRRLTENMTAFSEAPEDSARLIAPSRRGDEIGVAERQLRAMQTGLRAALKQKERLAALGTAVTKINHDLRNILATASLVSGRLESVDDPEVKRVTPTLFKAIDRAVTLCSQTLDYARGDTVKPRRAEMPLRTVIDDVGAELSRVAAAKGLELHNAVDDGFTVNADRDQLYRVLTNLGTNALEAGANDVRISATRQQDDICIEVSDNGRGLPAAARKHLFQPFAGSSRSGGTGLGLAIAHDLVEAHGGRIELVSTSEAGTVFRLVLPGA